jgi:hypothetical protein
MNEYNFRKACIIVGIKGNETMFRNYKFQSYKFLFSPKLFDNFLKFYINRIVTSTIETRIEKTFLYTEISTARQMMIKAAGGGFDDSDLKILSDRTADTAPKTNTKNPGNPNPNPNTLPQFLQTIILTSHPRPPANLKSPFHQG